MKLKDGLVPVFLSTCWAIVQSDRRAFELYYATAKKGLAEKSKIRSYCTPYSVPHSHLTSSPKNHLCAHPQPAGFAGELLCRVSVTLL
jgi:hypothetical protein